MTEVEFQARVSGLVAGLGRLGHHCHDSRLCIGPRGFPDQLVVGDDGLLMAELKMPGRRLDPDQVTWKYRLIAAGIPCYVWQPVDLESGLIECHIRAST